MAKITKAEFETLPESLKTKFKAVGDEFELIEAAQEDVEGLKASKAQILAEKKRIQDERDELLKFKTEHEAVVSQTEEERLKAAGEFKQLEEKLRAKITEVEADRETKVSQILSNLKQEKLKTFLVEKGVLPDRANYALADVGDQFDIESGEQGFTLKLKSGIGGAGELDGAVNALKEKAAFLFQPTNGAGSGASGSENKGGAGLAKAATKAEVAAMNPTDKREFYIGGGEVTDR